MMVMTFTPGLVERGRIKFGTCVYHERGKARSCSIAEAIIWEMRACDLMLARSEEGETDKNGDSNGSGYN